MKKTTIYIDENDLEKLKATAFINNCSVSEIIRREIKKMYVDDDPDMQRALKSLSKIRKNFKDYSEEEVMDIVNEEVEAVRETKKSGN